MRVCIVTGGMVPPETLIVRLVTSAQITIAADSGLDTLRACGLNADVAVGDFDSIEDVSVLDQVPEVHRYDRDKDETDTEIALRHARELGARDVGIVGGGGGDTAHFLGILGLFDGDHPPDWWYTDNAEIRLIQNEVKLTGRRGQVVSFFPVGTEICTMTSVGLRWPLDGLSWRRGDSGVRNEFLSDNALVSMQTGRLIMVRNLED